MLKRNLLQPRQLQAVDALITIAAEAARQKIEAQSAQQLLLHVHQLAGTNMADIQFALASAAAHQLNWRTLIVYPNLLTHSIDHTIQSTARLDREHKAVRLEAYAPAIESNAAAPTIIASLAQIQSEINLWIEAQKEKPESETCAAQGEPGSKSASCLITPDSYQLIIFNNPNERQPEDYRPVFPFFSGALLQAVWMSAKPSLGTPSGYTKEGVVTLFRPPLEPARPAAQGLQEVNEERQTA